MEAKYKSPYNLKVQSQKNQNKNPENKISKLVIILLTILTISNIIITIRIFNDRALFNSSDFIAYSIGARMILDGKGEDLYNIEIQKEYWKKINNLNQKPELFLPFIAPATTALFYIPFNIWGDVVLGYRLALFANALFIIWGIYFLAKFFKLKNPRLIVLASGAFMPTWVCLWQAQPTSLMFLLIILSMLTYKNKEKLSVFLLILALFLKPHHAITALPVFLVLNQSKKMIILKIWLAVILLFYIANAVITKSAYFPNYLRFLIHIDNPDYGNRWYEMYTIQSLLIGLLTNLKIALPMSKQIAIAISIPIYLLCLVYIHKISNKFNFNAAKKYVATMQTSLFFSYHVLSQDLILATIFMSVLMLRLNSHSEPTANKLAVLTLIIIAYFTIANPIAPLYGALLYLLTLNYLVDFSIRTKIVNKLSVFV